MKKTATRKSTVVGGTDRKKKKRRNPETLEPVYATREELLERLGSFELRGEPLEERTDEATLDALAGMGFRIVHPCAFCAEPYPDGSGIPACPNVATVTWDITRGEGLMAGTTHSCMPHAVGEKVWTPARKRSR